jgi:hypothetical protein
MIYWDLANVKILNHSSFTINDLIRVVTLHAAVMASGFLSYLVGCGIASNDSYQVCYLEKRVMLTEATGDAELVLWDGREFGHNVKTCHRSQ